MLNFVQKYRSYGSYGTIHILVNFPGLDFQVFLNLHYLFFFLPENHSWLDIEGTLKVILSTLTFQRWEHWNLELVGRVTRCTTHSSLSEPKAPFLLSIVLSPQWYWHPGNGWRHFLLSQLVVWGICYWHLVMFGSILGLNLHLTR